MTLRENKHFELIVHDDLEDTWGIRILDGQFNETIVAIGALAFNEVEDHMSFNFEVIETPDPDWVTPQNEELQEYVGLILNEVLRSAVEEAGAFEAVERKTIELEN